MRLDKPFPDEPLVETDEQAEERLPPYPIACVTYDACRHEGNAPAEALRRTLEIWRALQREGKGNCKGTDGLVGGMMVRNKPLTKTVLLFSKEESRVWRVLECEAEHGEVSRRGRPGVGEQESFRQQGLRGLLVKEAGLGLAVAAFVVG